MPRPRRRAPEIGRLQPVAAVPRHEPERTCIVTRTVRRPDEMIRFVLGPDGAVVPDLKHRLPGRGVWTGATAACVGEAVRRRLFARAFKAEARAEATLAADIDAAMLADLRGSLALANKAGAVVTGFTKVEAEASRGSVRALVHAREAATDGRRKLAAALRRGAPDTIWQIPIIDSLSVDELDMALGRVGVIHAAILPGPGGEGCLARWRRLQAYRGLEGHNGHDDDEVGARVAGIADDGETAPQRAELAAGLELNE